MGSGTIRLSVALTIVAGGLGWFGLKRVSPDGYQQLDVAVVDLVRRVQHLVEERSFNRASTLTKLPVPPDERSTLA